MPSNALNFDSNANSRSSRSTFRSQAENRVLARLLTCLVNEHLVQGFLVNPNSTNKLVKASTHKHWMCVISKNTDEVGEVDGSFWVPLQALPVVEVIHSHVVQVTLLDPEDIAMLPLKQFTLRKEYIEVACTSQVMQQLMKWQPSIDPVMVENIVQEMDNSVMHQEFHYCHRPPLPSLSTALAIDWEQVIVEGHATHPMNKARFAVPPTLPVSPQDDLLNPLIHFFVVPRDSIDIAGDFESLLAPLLTDLLDSFNPSMEVIVPVHQIQVPNILANFPSARQLFYTCPARAQASLRTVIPEHLPDVNLKLAIGLKITSAMRTISPWTAYMGPRFKRVADLVVEDKELLIVCHELASIVSNHHDPNVAKHLSCIIRQDAQHLCESKGQRVIVCAALTERDHSDEFVVNTLLNLDTAAKKERFFRHYARLFLRAFLPPVFKYGLSFEAHLQNVLARFRPKGVSEVNNDNGSIDWELVGFVVRDFGGIKVHQPTLFQATGIEVDVWNAEACVLTSNLDGLHSLAYHTMIQCHLHRFARALNVHYNAKGWEFVQHQLDALLPLECEVRSQWLQNNTTKWKAFIKMKLDGLYRDYLYTTIPNLITYRKPFAMPHD